MEAALTLQKEAETAAEEADREVRDYFKNSFGNPDVDMENKKMQMLKTNRRH